MGMWQEKDLVLILNTSVFFEQRRVLPPDPPAADIPAGAHYAYAADTDE
jgi:hypothetical protein